MGPQSYHSQIPVAPTVITEGRITAVAPLLATRDELLSGLVFFFFLCVTEMASRRTKPLLLGTDLRVHVDVYSANFNNIETTEYVIRFSQLVTRRPSPTVVRIETRPVRIRDVERMFETVWGDVFVMEQMGNAWDDVLCLTQPLSNNTALAELMRKEDDMFSDLFPFQIEDELFRILVYVPLRKSLSRLGWKLVSFKRGGESGVVSPYQREFIFRQRKSSRRRLFS